MKIAILSGKGGVGKSTVASMLALYMSIRAPTSLLDFDIGGPSISSIFPSELRVRTNGTQLIPLDILPSLQVLSIGYMVKKEDAVVWRAPKRISLLKRFLEAAQNEHVIVDTPPGLSEDLELLQQYTVIILTTSNNSALSDSAKSIEYCKSRNIKIGGIVENMAGLKCGCGEITYLFSRRGGELLAQQYEIPFLGEIRMDNEVVDFINKKNKNIDVFKKLRIYDDMEKIFGALLK